MYDDLKVDDSSPQQGQELMRWRLLLSGAAVQ